ncbi:MAG: SprT family zinc-dependent metalloprotease [Cloacibacillus sp.]
MADHIWMNGTDFEIRRNARRSRISLGIDEENRCFIAAPQATPAAELERVLKDNAESFLRKIKNAGTRAKAPSHKYAEGELFYFRGELFPLTLCGYAATPPIELRDGRFFCCDFEDKTKIRHNFEVWYARRLEELIHRELPPLCKKMGAGPKTVHIKETKTLWGSCSTTGAMTLNVRLALVPKSLMEYVMVHEICHFFEMNHSGAFWRRVKTYCPDYEKRRAELKKEGNIYRW